jgi:hypothetical protein
VAQNITALAAGGTIKIVTMKKLEKKAMKKILGGGATEKCRCVGENEGPFCCWDFAVLAPLECPKGSQYACFIPFCWQLPCANPAGD